MRFWMLLVAAAVGSAAPAIAQETADVSVETSRGLYVPGDTVEVIVTNGRKDPIWISGCAALQVQEFEAERYAPIALEKCVAEGDAVKIAPGTHVLSFTAESSQSGSILRAGVAFGWGCTQAGPLSGARCRDFGSRWSRNFRVSRKAESAQE
jgi:hypothetical protein